MLRLHCTFLSQTGARSFTWKCILMVLVMKLPLMQGGNTLRELDWGRAAASPKEPRHISQDECTFWCQTAKCPWLLCFCKGFSISERNSKKRPENWEEGKRNAKHVSSWWKCGAWKSPGKGFWLRRAGCCRKAALCPLRANRATWEKSLIPSSIAL